MLSLVTLRVSSPVMAVSGSILSVDLSVIQTNEDRCYILHVEGASSGLGRGGASGGKVGDVDSKEDANHARLKYGKTCQYCTAR